ncbi:hypothetical protein B0H14DRAFT_3585909, partial [Mycena olivaceomarginata]
VTPHPASYLLHSYSTATSLPCIISTASLLFGMTLVVVPKFSLRGMLESIVRHKITRLMLVPPQVGLLCKEPTVHDYDLSSVRVILCAAAPLSADINERLINLFPDAHIGQAYGQTECTGVAAMWPTRSKRGANGGELVPGVSARLIKSDGTLADYNEPVCLRWIRTGDQVMINKLQEVIYIDRLKEIIKVRGFQVSPAELEGCILAHLFVADTCVVGIPDSYSGEVPLAFVVPSEEALAMIERDVNVVSNIKASIMNHVAGLTASHKHLRRIEFVETIPKNPSGKLLRRVLRERAQAISWKL